MNDKLTALLKFLKELLEKKFTGSIKINFHKGNVCNDEVEKVIKEKIV